MAAPVKPNLVRALAKDTWAYVPTLADPTAPTTTEMTAATAFNLSASLFADQGDITATTNKVTLPQRLDESETYEANGPTQYSMSDLSVAFDPQAATGDPGKAAWAAIPENGTGYLVRRQGVSADTDFAVGDFVDTIPVEFGVKSPGKSATDASGVYVFSVPASVTGKPHFNVAIAA